MRAIRTLILATFVAAFAATFLLTAGLRDTVHEVDWQVAATPSLPHGETEVRVDLNPTVVHVSYNKSSRKLPAPLETAPLPPLLSSLAQPDATPSSTNLLPDRPVMQMARVAAPIVPVAPLLRSNAKPKKSADEEAVVAVLAEYSRAWAAKDLANIHALRPGLARRTLKDELSAARSIQMHIDPLGVPTIKGDKATVECMHRVTQVFDDGTERSNPGIRMTYELVKRGDNWLISDTR